MARPRSANCSEARAFLPESDAWCLETLGLKLRRGGIAPDAAEVRKAYLQRSRETHPDKGGASDEFQRVAKAAEILTKIAEGDTPVSPIKVAAWSGRPAKPRPSAFSMDDVKELAEQVRRIQREQQRASPTPVAQKFGPELRRSTMQRLAAEQRERMQGQRRTSETPEPEDVQPQTYAPSKLETEDPIARASRAQTEGEIRAHEQRVSQMHRAKRTSGADVDNQTRAYATGTPDLRRVPEPSRSNASPPKEFQFFADPRCGSAHVSQESASQRRSGVYEAACQAVQGEHEQRRPSVTVKKRSADQHRGTAENKVHQQTTVQRSNFDQQKASDDIATPQQRRAIQQRLAQEHRQKMREQRAVSASS